MGKRKTKEQTAKGETVPTPPIRIGDVIRFQGADLMRYQGQVIDIRAPGIAYVAVLGYPFLFPVTGPVTTAAPLAVGVGAAGPFVANPSTAEARRP